MELEGLGEGGLATGEMAAETGAGGNIQGYKAAAPPPPEGKNSDMSAMSKWGAGQRRKQKGKGRTKRKGTRKDRPQGRPR